MADLLWDRVCVPFWEFGGGGGSWCEGCRAVGIGGVKEDGDGKEME